MNTAISESVIATTVKPISPAPLSAASYGESAFLDVPDDVLDHDDGVVDHESDRDRQRHQRQIVEAVTEFVKHREGADQRQRHGDRRDNRRPEIRRNRKITITTSATVSSNVNCTSVTDARMVWVRSEMTTLPRAGSRPGAPASSP